MAGPGAGSTGAWASLVGMCRVVVRSGPGTGLPCGGKLGVDGAQRIVSGAWVSFAGWVPRVPQRKDPWAWRALRLESPRVSWARPRAPPHLAARGYLGAAARAGGACWAGGGPGSCPRRSAAGGGDGGAELRAETAREARLPGSGSSRDWGAPPFPPRPAPPARPADGRPPAVFLRAAGHAPPPDLRQAPPRPLQAPRLSPTALPWAPNPNLTFPLSP